MTQTPAPSDDRRARRNTAVLVAAMAVLGSQITMIFVIGGLAGQMLAPNACLATLPISLIVFGSMTTAPWLSRLMQARGRRTGFVIGALGGLGGSAIAAAGLWQGSFALFLAGSYFTGIYMSAQGFYRFAAADGASDAFRPKAISYVMAGGLVSAILGPQLVKITHDLFVVPFLGSYLVAMTINLAGMGLFALLDLPRPAPRALGALPGRTTRQMLARPEIRVAIICGMASYGLMNLVMTSTPLAVIGCGHPQGSVSDIVTFHVLAMFVPSFFTGHLIARFGAVPVVATGLAILGVAGTVALSGVDLGHFFATLILLGIGWNFGFIGATAMLSQHHAPEEAGRIQGINDALVFGCVTLASLASGGLMNCAGGSAAEGWSAVNMAMAPVLALAGGALIWLVLRPRGA
ncbi:MFS transporter [Mangrovicoccus algicola]|uniref:MFS transporter n=1 Tax=Mangrovicoccus algicola TaxID=2771008 RepID=A0A8J7CZD9_9RHOB|nr:MFS transporter [Mangrovicoccus algicola]MBE3640647.1 MFS transporter [Mangrovicoccus algicola]